MQPTDYWHHNAHLCKYTRVRPCKPYYRGCLYKAGYPAGPPFSLQASSLINQVTRWLRSVLLSAWLWLRSSAKPMAPVRTVPRPSPLPRVRKPSRSESLEVSALPARGCLGVNRKSDYGWFGFRPLPLHFCNEVLPNLKAAGITIPKEIQNDCDPGDRADAFNASAFQGGFGFAVEECSLLCLTIRQSILPTTSPRSAR